MNYQLIMHGANMDIPMGSILWKSHKKRFEEDQVADLEIYGWSIQSQVIKCKFIGERKRDSIVFSDEHLDSFVLVEEVEGKQILNDTENRVGQYQYKVMRLEACNHPCSICEEKTVNILEAAYT